VMEQSDPLKIAELVTGFSRQPSGSDAHRTERAAH
jgi:hypothetical protein